MCSVSIWPTKTGSKSCPRVQFTALADRFAWVRFHRKILVGCFGVLRAWKASETYSRPALVDTDSITSVGSRKKECDETYKRFVAGRRAQKARAPAKISLLATFFIEDTAPSFVDSACYQFPRIFHLIVVYSRCPTPAARLL